MEFKTYKKEEEYSFCFGAFPTMELLKNKPNQVLKLLIHEKLEKNDVALKILNLAKQHNIEIVTNSNLIEKLSKKGNVYIVGVFKKYQQKLTKASNQVVLVNPQDSGNIGTIMREMVGFNYENLAIILPGVDIYDPKVVRASMGAIFGLNIQLFNSFEEYLKQNKIKLYPFMLNGKTKLNDLKNIKTPHALVFGNEASGLDDNFLNLGESIVISHSNKIDSLNLAMSVGIALYEFSKQKNSF